jgi:S-formylglutathione hydrolase FrmB
VEGSFGYAHRRRTCQSAAWNEDQYTDAILQGTGDNFYKQGQLLPENLTKAAEESGNERGVNLRMQPDYDHSYYFMASFADDHVDHAAKYLLA